MRALWAIVWVVCTAPMAETLGQSAEPSPRFMEWWTRLLAIGGDNNLLDGVKIGYRQELHGVLPPDELAALRQAVRGHPEHPRRFELATYERRIENGPDATLCVLWRMDGMWRFNTQPLHKVEAYSDYVWSDEVAWGMAHDNIVILDPATAHQYPYGLPGRSSGFAFDCFLVFNGGLGLAALNGITLVPRVETNGRWVAVVDGVAKDGQPVHVESRGTWREDEGWGTVDETMWMGNQSMRFRTKGWKYYEALRLGVAKRGEFLSIDGRPQTAVELVEITSFSRSEFERLVHLPSPTGTDPVRGPVTYRSVTDLRGVAPKISIAEDGKLIPYDRTSTSGRVEDHLRIAGWLIAGSALLLIGVFWIRTRCLPRGGSMTSDRVQ